MLLKTDIQVVFCLLQVHPDSISLTVASQWDGRYPAPIPRRSVNFLKWVLRKEAQLPSVLNYFDYFLFLAQRELRFALLYCKGSIRFLQFIDFKNDTFGPHDRYGVNGMQCSVG